MLLSGEFRSAVVDQVEARSPPWFRLDRDQVEFRVALSQADEAAEYEVHESPQQ